MTFPKRFWTTGNGVQWKQCITVWDTAVISHSGAVWNVPADPMLFSDLDTGYNSNLLWLLYITVQISMSWAPIQDFVAVFTAILQFLLRQTIKSIKCGGLWCQQRLINRLNYLSIQRSSNSPAFGGQHVNQGGQHGGKCQDPRFRAFKMVYNSENR